MIVDRIWFLVVSAFLIVLGMTAIVRRKLPMSVREGFRQQDLEPRRGSEAVWGGIFLLCVGGLLAAWSLR
jgi:hypothetical protein